jgi:hypothetical protein
MDSDNDRKTARVIRLRRCRSAERPADDPTEIALQQQALQVIHAFLRIASAADRDEVIRLALRLAARN